MTVQVDKSAPFRVGIIIESFVQPRWVRKALEKVLGAAVSTFELVVKVPAEKDSGTSLLYKLYNRMDHRLFHARLDALELVSIDDLVGSLPIVSPDELEKIRAFDLDVLLSFGPGELNAKFGGLAKYGVWFYAFGMDEKAPPGFKEILTQESV